MSGGDAALILLVREVALFTASGFLVLGINELIIDVIWMSGRFSNRRAPMQSLALAGTCGEPELVDPSSAPLAVFVPAWQEAEVIGDMLRNTLRQVRYDRYQLFVGCYPNDPATVAAARAVDDPRVTVVVGRHPGGTTKADCLNTIWRAMIEEEMRRNRRFSAIVLHDAEDVVHPDSFTWFAALIGHYDMIQLPVVPLIDARSRWIAGHYADEFAESHCRDLPVRQHVGASLPSAGVG